MGRKYIGVELGKQAETHCYKRLKNVVDGDKTGISRDLNWTGGGGFGFYRLGESVFDEEGHINPNIKFAPLAAHVWFSETGIPFRGKAKSPFLSMHDGVAYALLYNGILGDKAVNGGNVLTRQIFKDLVEASDGFRGSWVIYGESSRITPAKLEEQNIMFKQTPYDIKAR
jgi:adenine-specific DNA-methyltransferase